MRTAAFTVAAVLSLSSVACGTGTKEQLLKTAFDSDATRHDLFEANLRVLDDNPRYVDEFFAHALKHPKTLDRFAANQARELDDPALARITARHLVNHPGAVRMVLLQTLDVAKGVPEARAAIGVAMEERAALASDIVTDRPSALSAILEAAVADVTRKPEARIAFLASMQRVSPTLAKMLAANPKTMRAMIREFLRVGMDTVKEELATFLKTGE
jgi:hypothetical protein